MWQPAVIRFGALALFALSCGGGTKATTIGNQATIGDRDPAGAYYCSIEDGGYRYPRFPCVVRKVDGRWLLAKLAGSQRFRGEVRPRGDGFLFDGELYCPWGDCTQPLHGVFRPAGNGVLRGTFRDAQLIVFLERAPDSAFGSANDGEAGDAGFGGWGYGGSTYGVPATPPGNRGP